MRINILVLVGLLLSACKTTAPATLQSTPAAVAAATSANEPPPNSEVFLASLDLAKGTVGVPRNISLHAGYDNQPAFLLDASALLYVSDRNGPTDVNRFDIAQGVTTQVTATEAGEFSPVPLTDGSGFSVIRVAKANAQGADSTNPPLWRYGYDGKPGESLVNITNVGYYAWLDNQYVALFVVGDEEKQLPNTLVLANRKTDTTILLSKAPGRQLGRTPDGKRVSFVDKSDPKHWRVVAMAPGDAQPSILVDTPQGAVDEQEQDRSEDYCWLPDGSLLMAKGETLLRWNGVPGTSLVPFAVMNNLGGDIKRLAVSKDGKHLAFVVQLRAP